MSDEAWATASATDLAAAIRSREISSSELLALYLDRIETLDGLINAVVTLDAERARIAAARADEVIARGEQVGPLHGLPVTIKDAIETEGIRSTGGAVELAEYVPAADAPAVARLKAAGAIVFGKTNLPRWSGDIETFNELFGTTNNPWDTTCVPGGSSGGPAAAVACGFTSFELGTDIAGSIRVPSHFCGTFGLKPSFGVVSQRGYLDHVGGGTTDADLNVFGPIARSASDLDLLLGVLAGPDAEHAPAWRLELPAPTIEDITGVRIAVWFDEPGYPIDAEYRGILGSVGDALTDAGANVEAGHPPVDMADQVNLFLAMVGAAASVSFPDDVAGRLSGSHRSWLRREERRALLRRTWAEWFTGVDALLCPVAPTPAFPHNQVGDFLTRTIEINGEPHPGIDHAAWTGLIGILGLPSAVVPVGRTRAGLPVGVQVVTPFLNDRSAIRLAGLIASLTCDFAPPPVARSGKGVTERATDPAGHA